jgi:hypothetical protein
MNALASMTLGEIFYSAAGMILALSVFVEITPIKINPVSDALKWLGKKCNADMAVRMDKMEQRIDDMERKNGERDIIVVRSRILRFGDEVRRKERHSEEHFDQILSDIDDYEKYCDTHKDFKNNKTKATTARILEVYQECVRQNDFL